MKIDVGMVFLIGFSLVAGCRSPKPPPIEFDSGFIDLGQAFSGETVIAEVPFSVVKSGEDAPKVDSTCGCTKPELIILDKVLSPGDPLGNIGQEGLLRVRIDDPARLGEGNYKVRLATNEGPVEIVRFHVTWKPRIQCNPPTLNFGAVRPGTSVIRTFAIERYLEAPIAAITSNNSIVEVELLEGGSGNTGGQLRHIARLTGDGRLGKVHGAVTVNFEDGYSFMIPWQANLNGAFSTSTERISFGPLASDAIATEGFDIEVFDRSVVSGSPSVRATDSRFQAALAKQS